MFRTKMVSKFSLNHSYTPSNLQKIVNFGDTVDIAHSNISSWSVQVLIYYMYIGHSNISTIVIYFGRSLGILLWMISTVKLPFFYPEKSKFSKSFNRVRAILMKKLY